MPQSAHAPATPLIAPGETFGVIGTGVMGQTILKGLLTSGALQPQQAWASAKSQATCDRASEALGIAVERDIRPRVASAGVIVLCVKPAQAAAALAPLKDAGLPPDALLISILAGTALAQVESALGTANPWVRAMPNTPCTVGEGMTAICSGTYATPTHLARARQVFECVGRCVEADEYHFDAITALSGSGPAYLYLMMEAMFGDGLIHVCPVSSNHMNVPS